MTLSPTTRRRATNDGRAPRDIFEEAAESGPPAAVDPALRTPPYNFMPHISQAELRAVGINPKRISTYRSVELDQSRASDAATIEARKRQFGHQIFDDPAPDHFPDGNVGSDEIGETDYSNDDLPPQPQADEDASAHHAYRIPCGINDFSMIEAARFYRDFLLLPVHPLRSIHDERAEKPGKEPLLKGHRNFTTATNTEDFLASYFSEGSNFNIGGIIPLNLVWIDFDSKQDHGLSARIWLDSHPEFANHPRVGTRNGFHLPAIVLDLPPKAKSSAHKINDTLVVELLRSGSPVTLAPSLRLDGVPYSWETTGDIPEFEWDSLRSALGIPTGQKAAKSTKIAGSSRQGMLRFMGDLATLDLLEILRVEGLLGESLDDDTAKWSVTCPWQHEHSDQKTTPDSSTVVFVPPGRAPSFNCLHAHCQKRGVLDLCLWLEDLNPGVIDAHCSRRRAYRVDEAESTGGLPFVRHPGSGRMISETAVEVGRIIAPHHEWFNRNGILVEVSCETSGKGLRFREITPVTACAGIERFMVPVAVEKGGIHESLQMPRSFDREMMAKLLAAPQFVQQLPVISRVISVPLAIIDPKTGRLVDLQPGYNPGHELFLDPEFGRFDIIGADEAVVILRNLLRDFCFETEQDRIHAIARIITPYVRPIMGWTARVPLWIFVANRPRAGKDYQAMLVPIIYEGDVCEDAPLERNQDETRKRITAALLSGRRLMHFANCQGHLDDAALTSAVTARTIGVRQLGGAGASNDLRLPNEIEFSISANIGITFREDIGPRSRRISLAYQEEDPNSRRFQHPDLHGVVRCNRRRILGAIHAVVNIWVEQGCPSGPTPFTSFPEWAQIVGGIMDVNGLGDPCLPHASELALGGDLKERALRAVYGIGFATWPGHWVTKDELFRVLAGSGDEDLGFFGSFIGVDTTKTRTRAGMALTAYKGRILSGVILEVDPAGKGSQQRVRFSRHENNGCCSCETASPDGTLGTLGTLGTFGTLESGSGINQISYNTNSTTLERDCSSGSVAWEGSEGSKGSGASPLLTDSSQIPAIASQIMVTGVVALSIQPQGIGRMSAPGPRRGRVQMLMLAVPGLQPWGIELHQTGSDLGPLKDALEASVIVMHDARPGLGILHAACGLRARQVFCTLTAARLLINGTDEPKDIASLLHRYLGITAEDGNSTPSTNTARPDPTQPPHAAFDIRHLHALRQVLESDIDTNGLAQVADLEMCLIPVVVDIEAVGLPLDLAEVERRRSMATEDAETALTELRRLSGTSRLNPDSPEQIRTALTALGLDLPDTKAETLALHNGHPAVAALLTLRNRLHIAKVLEVLAEWRRPDGRLHTSLDPLGTDTGRFTSSNPCLHNIPRCDIRCVVRPPSGRVFVKADYSQIDLRAVAVIADEPEMLRAFNEGLDLHRLTASRITGKPPEEVTSTERQEAKAANFGFIYGQGADGFLRRARAEYGLDLSRERAMELRQSFFDSYPGIDSWHDRTRLDADQDLTEVRTRSGRRRLLPPELGGWDRFALALNTPVQGVVADGMKMALVELHNRLPEGARIVLTIHDDVLVECPEEISEDIRRLVEEVLRTQMSCLLPEVPIVVESEILESWG